VHCFVPLYDHSGNGLATRSRLWLFLCQQLPWPPNGSIAGRAWVLLRLCGGLYLWEKLWDWPNSALSLGLAAPGDYRRTVICSLIYERRLWWPAIPCPHRWHEWHVLRKTSSMELPLQRSTGWCGSQCSTFWIATRGAKLTMFTFGRFACLAKGRRRGACPLYHIPHSFKINRDCVLCMNLLKACRNRSVSA